MSPLSEDWFSICGSDQVLHVDSEMPRGLTEGVNLKPHGLHYNGTAQPFHNTKNHIRKIAEIWLNACLLYYHENDDDLWKQ